MIKIFLSLFLTNVNLFFHDLKKVIYPGTMFMHCMQS